MIGQHAIQFIDQNLLTLDRSVGRGSKGSRRCLRYRLRVCLDTSAGNGAGCVGLRSRRSDHGRLGLDLSRSVRAWSNGLRCRLVDGLRDSLILGGRRSLSRKGGCLLDSRCVWSSSRCDGRRVLLGESSSLLDCLSGLSVGAGDRGGWESLSSGLNLNGVLGLGFCKSGGSCGRGELDEC